VASSGPPPLPPALPVKHHQRPRASAAAVQLGVAVQTRGGGAESPISYRVQAIVSCIRGTTVCER
jgi:hypothetical protein